MDRVFGSDRREPDDYLDIPISARAIARHLGREKSSLEDRFNILIPSLEKNEGTKQLLGFLFPSLSDESRDEPEHADAFCQRRPLLTTLRHGLLPGAFSRDDIQALVASPSEQVAV